MDEQQFKDTLRMADDHNKSILNALIAGLRDIVESINKDCIKGTSNERRIETLEREMGEGRGDIKEIKDNLLGRPTWPVTIIIAFLLSLSTACITFAIK